jgi:hypothetical protein
VAETPAYLHLKAMYTPLDEGADAYTRGELSVALPLLEVAHARLGRALAEVRREKAFADTEVAVLNALYNLPETGDPR